jgi:hypothetical protein
VKNCKDVVISAVLDQKTAFLNGIFDTRLSQSTAKVGSVPKKMAWADLNPPLNQELIC